MLQDTKLAFIGTGVMAESMIKGILHELSLIHISEPTRPY